MFADDRIMFIAGKAMCVNVVCNQLNDDLGLVQ